MIAAAAYHRDIVSCAVLFVEIEDLFVVTLEDALQLISLQKVGYERPFTFFQDIAAYCIYVMGEFVVIA